MTLFSKSQELEEGRGGQDGKRIERELSEVNTRAVSGG
jgi:hypothetical protein